MANLEYSLLFQVLQPSLLKLSFVKDRKEMCCCCCFNYPWNRDMAANYDFLEQANGSPLQIKLLWLSLRHK